MHTDHAMAQAIARLAQTLDARPVPHCPGCGRSTDYSPTGHPCYCLACTEASIGERLPELLARVSLGKSRRAYLKWLVDRKIAERRATYRGY